MGLSFTNKQLFDPNLWPYSLVYLLMIPNINPRQQLQMIVLQYLLKPSIENHLPRVVLFLERQSIFNLYFMAKFDAFEKAKQLSGYMFDLDIQNYAKSVKGAKINSYLRFHFPYFEVINLRFELTLQS
jgi:hypothetical protein